MHALPPPRPGFDESTEKLRRAGPDEGPIGLLLGGMARTRIAEFARFDPVSITLRHSQVRLAPGRGFGPILSEAHVDLFHLRRTMRPIRRGLVELAIGLTSRDRAAVRRALATMGGARARG